MGRRVLLVMISIGYRITCSRTLVMAAERSWGATTPRRTASTVTAFLTAPPAPARHHPPTTNRSPFCGSRTYSATAKRQRAYPRLKKKHGDGDMDEALYRADRVLANRTGKPRSECTQLLKQQRISILDDSHGDNDDDNSIVHLPVAGPSVKISMHANLRLDKDTVIPPLPPLLMAFHKPKWILSVKTDPYGRPCLDETSLPPDIPKDMHPVGRLDYDSSGLLLFSSNGALTQTLLHPKHQIPKEYVAVVTGVVDKEALSQQLAMGVKTSDGVFTAELLEATPFDDNHVKPYLQSIRDGLPPEYRTAISSSSRNEEDDNSSSSNEDDDYLDKRSHLRVLSEETTSQLTTVRLVVSEGKYRMVRRILANSGHPVVSLHRERIGSVSIQDLPAGQCRPLTPTETIWAHGLAPKQKKK